MKENIQQIYDLCVAALAHAPEECECTDSASRVFECIDKLRDAIEDWKADGEKLTTEAFSKKDYENIKETF